MFEVSQAELEKIAIYAFQYSLSLSLRSTKKDILKFNKWPK